MPRNAVTISTATHRQNAAEARIRRPWGKCASIDQSVVDTGRSSGVRLCRGAHGQAAPMGIGTSIFLIAVGAILYFAVNAVVSGLVISLFFLGSLRRGPAERTVVRDREPY